MLENKNHLIPWQTRKNPPSSCNQRQKAQNEWIVTTKRWGVPPINVEWIARSAGEISGLINADGRCASLSYLFRLIFQDNMTSIQSSDLSFRHTYTYPDGSVPSVIVLLPSLLSARNEWTYTEWWLIGFFINCLTFGFLCALDRYVFLGIYSCEMVIKAVAKGLVLDRLTYLRSPWNWLDFVVILSGYATLAVEIGNLAGLRTFRVLRALKTVSIIPGIVYSSIFNSIEQP